MLEYLAKYRVHAYEIGFGGGRPYEENETHKFEASDEKKAIKLALEEGKKIVQNRIGATVTLESLFETKEILINKTQITKLPMTNITIAKIISFL